MQAGYTAEVAKNQRLDRLNSRKRKAGGKAGTGKESKEKQGPFYTDQRGCGLKGMWARMPGALAPSAG